MNTGSPLPKPSETRQVPETEKEKVKCKTAQANCGRKCNERDVCVPSVELKNFSLPSIFFYPFLNCVEVDLLVQLVIFKI